MLYLYFDFLNWKPAFQVGLRLAKAMPQQSRCHPFGRPGGSHSGSSPCRPRQFHQFHRLHQFLHPRHLVQQPEPIRELQESAEASWLALLVTDILPVFRLFKRLSPGNRWSISYALARWRPSKMQMPRPFRMTQNSLEITRLLWLSVFSLGMHIHKIHNTFFNGKALNSCRGKKKHAIGCKATGMIHVQHSGHINTLVASCSSTNPCHHGRGNPFSCSLQFKLSRMMAEHFYFNNLETCYRQSW